MRDEFVLRLVNKHIKQLIRVLNQCPPEKRSIVPEGYKNNIHWHLGHVLVITHFDVLILSEQTGLLPDHYQDFFAYGSKPADWQGEPPEWDELIAKLKELNHHIHETLKDRLDEPVRENALHTQNIGELIYLTAVHMKYHQGVVYGMLNSLKSRTAEAQDDLTTVNENAVTPNETAIFTGGCFWHMEEVFQKLGGVSDVYTGYSGGQDTNPTYNKVVSKTTDQLESVEVHYNPDRVTYDELLKVFWQNVDPTDDQSAIFYKGQEQRERAEASRKELRSSRWFHKPIGTKIAEATPFYKAEDEHQDYYKKSTLSFKVSEFLSGGSFIMNKMRGRWRNENER
ncbi:peptide-methionine (S)-S-oxide reductase MsrA [Paenibacillus sp. BC26]|uniref:peptide-methionine (S)-S-oxide reductase MsrA n=1 Tax=Paenibacillus sp. BC26 TaxID=1881032 RepID=UPI0008E98DF6|nr:peptide-methionine (S)-S-oxide reductase MsrA [Paenibacillus sp. BC26]SFT13260.1 methionine-S-sulfoxide reductase [Paenibacillus sp. BC26]